MRTGFALSPHSIDLFISSNLHPFKIQPVKGWSGWGGGRIRKQKLLTSEIIRSDKKLKNDDSQGLANI